MYKVAFVGMFHSADAVYPKQSLCLTWSECEGTTLTTTVVPNVKITFSNAETHAHGILHIVIWCTLYPKLCCPWCVWRMFMFTSVMSPPFYRTGFSLAGGVFPICWKGLSSLLGCSNDLMNSCVQGPRAKTPATTERRGVPGICTYPSLPAHEAPLQNKGDQVET